MRALLAPVKAQNGTSVPDRDRGRAPRIGPSLMFFNQLVDNGILGFYVCVQPNG